MNNNNRAAVSMRRLGIASKLSSSTFTVLLSGAGMFIGLPDGSFARAAEIQVAAEAPESVQTRAGVSPSRSGSASKPASPDSKADARSLTGRSPQEVEAT